MSRRRKHVPFDERFGPWDPNLPGRECDPTYRLEEHIASLRDTDPEKWAALNAEWSTSVVPIRIEEHAASRRNSDPEKWARLNADWDAPFDAFQDCPVGRDLQLISGDRS